MDLMRGLFFAPKYNATIFYQNIQKNSNPKSTVSDHSHICLGSSVYCSL